MPIEQWLASLGLGGYASRFAENDIDFTILPELTDQDLEKIGVASLGHRRKILRAIVELRNAPAAAAAPASPRPAAAPQPAPPAAPPWPASTAEAAGERRYLTVMFCDLVGSTGIAAKLDAEEWRDLVGGYLDAASAAVTQMGGYVAKKLGDGILALFGYPVAHENDAERAARAALAIQRALADLNRRNAGSNKPELSARIGLETGPAVVDAAGEIYGDVANVAARVQALAEPGAVLVTARVQRQVAGLFVAEERGTHTLKGVPEPTALFKLVRASGGGRRAGQRQLTPLVGREDEMAMLLRRWQRARAGEGQLVMIVGEPGLGKSRLIEEFHTRLSDTPHTWVEWSCSQLLQNTPLHPIAEWGRSRFGAADVPAERRLADLENSLAQVKLDPAEIVPLVAPLLDMPLPKERMPALAGEELRRRQLAALTNWVMAGARTQPLVLAFEDLHWADPTTLDVLRGIAERGALAPLYIVATTRPEFRPPWSMRSHHGTISLAPLDRAQVRDMVGELAARHALSREVIEDVAARTGGVPLFVEEVTRLLLERGGESGIQAIPPTLQQSLMARLDRLGPAREVAQVGSVIGRGFSYKLLRDVAAMEDAPLQAALEKLADADIVLVQGLPPESDYRFKHALIQDAAYENLLKSRRQVLHRRVAETLRDRFADAAAAEPEVLAHHFTQAGMTDAAIEWWGKAGDQALRRSAFQEAISHLGKAIEMADKEGEAKPRAAAAPVTADQRLKLQTDYGQAVMWSKGFGSEEAKTAFARAKELAEGVDKPDERFATYYGQWIGSALRGELGLARETLESFLHEANERGARAEAAVAHRVLGLTCHVQGEFTIAQQHLDEALRIYDPQHDREITFRFGQDTAATARAYLAHTDWQFGNFQRMRELMEDAVAHAVESSHPPTLANVYYSNVTLEALRGDAERTLRVGEMLREVSEAHGLALYLALAAVYSGWARARSGDAAAGVFDLQKGIAAYTALGNKWYVPLFQGLLAELEAELGGTEQALRDVDAALALAAETGERWTDALLYRTRGEILLKRDPANTAPAEEAFLTAIAVAQQQKAKSFELRAALALAKLYQSTGRAADAHAVLAPALEGFSPTPEFPEIEQAQALLAALAETDEVKNAAAARQRRLQLQTGLANALLQARGMQSPETQVAFSHARELAGGVDDPLQRFSSYYGLWAGHYVRGEVAPMREIAELVLREIETRPFSLEAGVALRLNGATEWFTGDFTAARSFLERALAVFDPQDYSDHAFRFAQDIGVSITAYLALVLWTLGEVDRARTVAEQMIARATQTGHASTIGYGHFHFAVFEMMRRSSARAAPHIESLVDVSRAHEMGMWTAYGKFLALWSRRGMDGSDAGLAEMREGIAICREQGVGNFIPFFKTALAEAGAEAGELDAALATIDDAIAETELRGQRSFEAESHRLRGEILLKRDPANTAPAEEAFLTAIAIAQQQKAKSFELRAALALAKLYQSTGRAADAHAVLAPALAGFSPTPEFPEIAEAQALLAALAEDDQVRAALGKQQARAKLHVDYARAMQWRHGFGADEARGAIERAGELAVAPGQPEYWGLTYARFAVSLLRGEFLAARKIADAYLRQAEVEGRPEHAVAARRMLGSVKFELGAFSESREEFERMLANWDEERDKDLRAVMGSDVLCVGWSYMAQLLTILGKVENALRMSEDAIRRAESLGDFGSLAFATSQSLLVLATLGRVEAVLRRAEVFEVVAAEKGAELFASNGRGWAIWARGLLTNDAAAAADKLRKQLNAKLERKERQTLHGWYGLLGELQGAAGAVDDALASIAEGLQLAREIASPRMDAHLHRLRGDILAKRDPAAAEAAYREGLRIAREQGARTFELQAAHALAKLYQRSNRAAEAHAVLAPALEGFTPTPEFPEIEQAQMLLNALTA